MGFYLRKSFRAGPLRLNMSKGGLGVSLGVTGARIGVDSRGRSYVHAGRGGFYVKEYLSGAPSRRPSVNSGQQPDASMLYEDTGVTFPVESIPSAHVVPLEDRLVRKKLNAGVYLLLPVAGAVLAAVVASDENMSARATIAFGIIALVLLAVWPIPVIRAIVRNRRGLRLGQTLQARLSSRVPLTPADRSRLRQAIQDPRVTQAERDYQCKVAYLQLLSAIVADGSATADELALLQTVEGLFDLGYDFCSEARLDVFRQRYLEAVADHDLSEQEDAVLNQIMTALDIPEHAISDEMELVEQLREVRSIRSGHLSQVESARPLTSGEICHYEGLARVLKTKVLRSFQMNREKYSVRGLAIAREGTLLITNRRLLIVQEGTTSIPFSKMLDIEFDYDRNLITITKDGANAPVYLSTPDSLRVSAILATASGH